MRNLIFILLSLSLAGCQTLGATGVKKISSQNKQTVYEVHSQTGSAYSNLQGYLYSGSEEYKAYKKLPAEQQTLSDLQFRKKELARLARQKCSGDFKVVKNFIPSWMRVGGGTWTTSKFQFSCI